MEKSEVYHGISQYTSSPEPRTFMDTWIKPNLPETPKQWFLFTATILLVMFVCAWGFNQLLEAQFKMQFLQGACKLCESYGNSCYNSNPFNLNFSNLSVG